GRSGTWCEGREARSRASAHGTWASQRAARPRPTAWQGLCPPSPPPWPVPSLGPDGFLYGSRRLVFDDRSFVPFLETPHAARSAAQSDDRIASGTRGRHRRRVRHAVHQRRAPDRVIVRLRELPEGRVDQELHVARHDQIDRVRPPFVDLGHSLGRHPAGSQVPRRALGGRETKPHLVEPPRDRQHGRFVRVVHRHEDPPRERQAAVGSDLRNRKSTRLNSSHVSISYAVFCLKKKKEKGKSGTASFGTNAAYKSERSRRRTAAVAPQTPMSWMLRSCSCAVSWL